MSDACTLEGDRGPIATLVYGDKVYLAYDREYNYGEIPFGLRDVTLDAYDKPSSPCPSCGGPRSRSKCSYCGSTNR